jgi:type-F conjugative transfer system pilin assembly protein TrbC
MAAIVVSLGPPQILAKTVIIETPNLCAHVEKIEGSRVDLTVAKEPCPIEGPGKASIRIGEEVKEIDIYVNKTYWKEFSTSSQSLSIGDVADVIDGAKKYGGDLSLPENPHQTEAQRIAEGVSRYFQSEEFQERIESERTRLYGEVYGNQAHIHQEVTKVPGKVERLSTQERIYLFISSSVPVPTLRHYIQAISNFREPNIRVVMRGFVSGARFVKPTMAFLKEILFIDPECDPTRERCRTYGVEVIIDPLLFGRYRVEKVPAFVYVPSISISDSQMSEGLESNKIPNNYLVYGDMSIEYALRLFSRERKSPGLEGLPQAIGQSENRFRPFREGIRKVQGDRIK